MCDKITDVEAKYNEEVKTVNLVKKKRKLQWKKFVKYVVNIVQELEPKNGYLAPAGGKNIM